MKNRMHAILPLLPAAILLFAAGCYRSSGGSPGHDTLTDDHVDPPDVTHDDARPDTVPDLPHDPPPPDMERQCNSDDDCVIVLNQNRCCMPDPVAMPRVLVGSNPCWHILGESWTENPGCPDIECYACGPISTRAYAARCEEGVCVPVTDFCPTADDPVPWPVTWADAATTPRGGWEQYRGQVVALRGYVSLEPDACECCTYCRCTCDSPAATQALSCAISLRGSNCGRPWECSGTECEPSCSPGRLSGDRTMTGYLIDSEAEGWELWVLADEEDCPPYGPNPEGSPCTPFSETSDCAEGLFCFFWGDVVAPCIGTCRAPGTECSIDPDCDEGETCYQGYCMWCCPG